jgi:hypothetical protein
MLVISVIFHEGRLWDQNLCLEVMGYVQNVGDEEHVNILFIFNLKIKIFFAKMKISK